MIKKEHEVSNGSMVSLRDLPAPPPVVVSRRGAVLTLTLSRPLKANALNLATIQGLAQAIDEAEADLSIRAVVLRGAGRNFCGGADLAELMEGGAAEVRVVMDTLRELLRRLESSRLAIVAAVHGAARAGGLEIALACDAVVAADTATFGDAHLANGLLPAGGATARLPRTVGWQRAKWLVLSAQAITAAAAKEWGLVMAVCAETDLEREAEAMAASLISAEEETFARAKALFERLPHRAFDEALEAEITTLVTHTRSNGFRDGIARFLTRRRA